MYHAQIERAGKLAVEVTVLGVDVVVPRSTVVVLLSFHVCRFTRLARVQQSVRCWSSGEDAALEECEREYPESARIPYGRRCQYHDNAVIPLKRNGSPNTTVRRQRRSSQHCPTGSEHGCGAGFRREVSLTGGVGRSSGSDGDTLDRADPDARSDPRTRRTVSPGVPPDCVRAPRRPPGRHGMHPPPASGMRRPPRTPACARPARRARAGRMPPGSALRPPFTVRCPGSTELRRLHRCARIVCRLTVGQRLPTHLGRNAQPARVASRDLCPVDPWPQSRAPSPVVPAGG